MFNERYVNNGRALKATQLQSEAILYVNEGEQRGNIGDYFCQNEKGEQFILPKSYIESHYQSLDSIYSEFDLQRGYEHPYDMESTEDWSDLQHKVRQENSNIHQMM